MSSPGPAAQGRPHAPLSAFAVVAVAFAWLYVFPYHRQLNNPNENSRVYLTMAMVENGTFSIDKILARYGWVNDLAKRETVDASGKKVLHHYIGKAPGTSFVGVPVYWAVHRGYARFAKRLPSKAEAIYWLRLGAMVVPSVVFLVFFRRFLVGRVGDGLAALGVLAFGLGTMATPYTMMYASHQHTAIACFGAFLLARSAALADRASAPLGPVALRLAGAGALVGFAAMSEYPYLLVVVVMGVYALLALRRRLRVAAFVAGGVPMGALLTYYHWKAFGSVATTAYAHLANPQFAKEHAEGFFGLVRPSLTSLGGTFFAPDYGLFVLSPFLLLGVIAFAVIAVRPSTVDRPAGVLDRADAVVALGILGVLWLFNASMNIWRAGWCVGPRYIAAVCPFLAAGAVLGLHRWQSTLRSAVAREALFATAGALGVIGLVLTGLSGLCYPHYPLQFTNPVFELLLPLLKAGYLPHHAGELVGLPGFAGVVPLVIVLGLVALVVAGFDPRAPAVGARRAALALTITVALLWPYSKIGRPSPAKASSFTFVARTWEPQPRRATAAVVGPPVRLASPRAVPQMLRR